MLNPMRNRVTINWFIQENLGYLPTLLPVVSSSDGLLTLLKAAFKPVTKIYIDTTNKYQC